MFFFVPLPFKADVAVEFGRFFSLIPSSSNVPSLNPSFSFLTWINVHIFAATAFTAEDAEGIICLSLYSYLLAALLIDHWLTTSNLVFFSFSLV